MWLDLSRNQINKPENHADTGGEGILGKGKNKCTDPDMGTCLAGLRIVKWPVCPLEWKRVLALECYREWTDQTEGCGQKEGCLCSYRKPRAWVWVAEAGMEGKICISNLCLSGLICYFYLLTLWLCVLELLGFVCTFYNRIQFGLQFPKVCGELEEQTEE